MAGCRWAALPLLGTVLAVSVVGAALAERRVALVIDETTVARGPSGRPSAARQPRDEAGWKAQAAAGERPVVLLAQAPSGDAAPGTLFRDCPRCPEMVVVPAGTFLMGSPTGEASRDPDEGPQHEVRIERPFALGRFEVTFAEWDACVADGGCAGHVPEDQGWGRETRPVVDVSWDDAQAYLRWLGEKTSQEYRLPSEAEWEYAARAGTATTFSTGATITTDQANFNGNRTYGGSRKGVFREQTVPVGSFAANPFGLHDLHGNVYEWVEDCGHPDYDGAPADGSAWTAGDCSQRVFRGGSWGDRPAAVRSAVRETGNADLRMSIIGLRVARTIAP